MTGLAEHAEDYLRLRRALGYKLERAGCALPQLVGYLQAAGARTVTAELAIAWARLPEQAQPAHWAARLAIARGFAAYLQTIDPSTEVPPAGVFPAHRHRPTPYVWSTTDVVRLLQTASGLRPQLKGATYQALFGLLAVTGMRLGEALAVQRADVALPEGVVTIRHAKFDRARLVPLHPTTIQALATYATDRDRLCPTPRSTTFFISVTGGPLDRSNVDKTLRTLTTQMGIRTQTVRPRAHDLRHRFAVATLIGWQQADVDIDRNMPVLSTYLGHIAPSDTYWYLSAVPELMALTARRLDARYGARP